MRQIQKQNIQHNAINIVIGKHYSEANKHIKCNRPKKKKKKRSRGTRFKISNSRCPTTSFQTDTGDHRQVRKALIDNLSFIINV